MLQRPEGYLVGREKVPREEVRPLERGQKKPGKKTLS